MTHIIQSLSEIADQYDALFCDLWGCLHNGVAPFPAAVSALQAFRAKGGKVILLTNAPRPKSSVVAQLDRMGVPRDVWDDVVSSGDATQIGMIAGTIGQKVHHIGADKDEPYFTDFAAELQQAAAKANITRVSLSEAEGIVCTGLTDDLTETPADYAEVLASAKAKDLAMLCANPDIIVDMGHKRIYCAGAIAQAYEEIGGRVHYYGKPHAPIYDLARARIGANDRILCVGDGIITDVLGAQNENLDALFVTGGIAAAEFGDDSNNPDPARLENWLESQSLAPRWSIGHLR